MPDTIFGVPLHPLVVHAVVVLVPLAVLGTIAIAVVPRWRTTYGWLVVATSAVAFATVPMVTRSGNRLRESLELGGPVAEKVDLHQQYGERMIYAVGVLLALDLALVLLHRSGRRDGLMTVVAVLAVAAAIPALVLVVLTGHTGATAVWNPAG